MSEETGTVREKIGGSDSGMDILMKLGEGNPGALRVCADVMKASPVGMMDLLHLDDMNMRGPQIWVAYKDFAGEDLAVFLEAVKARNPEMVAKVNEQCGDRWTAVTNGASFS